jgi:aminopeptidase
MKTVHAKYADLLANYCLELKKGERVYVRSTYLAEPLLVELQRAILEAGAHPHFNIAFDGQDSGYFRHAQDHQLDFVSPFDKEVMERFEAYLFVRAPFNTKELQDVDTDKTARAKKARSGIQKRYMERTGTRDMKRSLCQYPTAASAQAAGMSTADYEQFVYDACFLFEDDPTAAWLDVRKQQQAAVDLLNGRESIRYHGPDFDIRFSTKGRTWINSDGQTNMPSGEVYTSPVENSVEGTIRFSFPGVFQGQDIEDIVLTVEGGEVVKWEAKRGRELLDRLLDLPGARRFGEAAIGTNYRIQRLTRNMLFDEKMGGTVHMALGQSYFQTGGKNVSDIHWDLLADMRKGGEIYADDELIYRNGAFVF